MKIDNSKMFQKSTLVEKAKNFINSDKMKEILDSGFSFEIIDKKHTKDVIKWRNDPEILSQFINQEKLTEKKQNKFLKNYQALNRIDFILIDKFTREPCGSFYLTNLFSKKPEMGKLIGNKKIRGRGIAYKATRVLLKFVFEELKMKNIYAITKSDNVANIHLNKKLGFTVISEEERDGRIFITMTLKNNLV